MRRMAESDFTLWRNVLAGNAPAASDDGDGLPPLGALMSPAEAAVLLGVSRAAVYRWCESDPIRLGYFRRCLCGLWRKVPSDGGQGASSAVLPSMFAPGGTCRSCGGVSSLEGAQPSQG